jgi:hypothetical protein
LVRGSPAFGDTYCTFISTAFAFTFGTCTFRWDALTSVWCFFAAILSGLVLAAVVLENHLPAATRVRIGVQADSGR